MHRLRTKTAVASRRPPAISEALEPRHLLSATYSGELDPNFGENGIAHVDIHSLSATAAHTASTPDGRTLIAGTAGEDPRTPTHFVARLNADGSRDTTFGSDGLIAPPFDVTDIASDAGGRVIVAGASPNTPVGYASDVIEFLRYLPDGSTDASFGKGGKLDVKVRFDAVASNFTFQPDGRMLFLIYRGLGHSDKIGRLNTDGTLDRSFGKRGIVRVKSSIGAGQIAVGADGEIVVVGQTSRPGPPYGIFYSRVLAERFTATGRLDHHFGHAGLARFTETTSFVEGTFPLVAHVLPDGSVIIGERYAFDLAHNQLAVARLDNRGQPMAGFGAGGLVVTQFPAYQGETPVMTVDAQNRVVMAAIVPDTSFTSMDQPTLGVRAVRLTSDGALDPTFGFPASFVQVSEGSDTASLKLAGIALAANGIDFNVVATRRDLGTDTVEVLGFDAASPPPAINPAPFVPLPTPNLENYSGMSIALAADSTSGMIAFAVPEMQENHSVQQELWTSGGDPASTHRIGTKTFLSIDHLTLAGGLIYFEGETSQSGKSLWRSDGTESGTFPVRTGFFYNLTSFGDRVAFFAPTVSLGTSDQDRLWISDGTPAGTNPTYTFNNVIAGPSSLEQLHGQLIVQTKDPSGQPSLYSTDGTTAGTQPLIAFPSGTSIELPAGGDPPVGDVLYFNVEQDDIWQIWQTDGTATGTHAVTHVVGGLKAAQFTSLGGRVYFAGIDSRTDTTFWMFDASAAGAHAIGAADTFPASLGSVVGFGNALLFVANNEAHGEELWKLDLGTGTATVLHDIIPDSMRGYSLGGGPTVFGGRVFFSAIDAVHGDELWSTDGTKGVTHFVKDLYPGSDSSDPVVILNLGSRLVLLAKGPYGTGLWSLDASDVAG